MKLHFRAERKDSRQRMIREDKVIPFPEREEKKRKIRVYRESFEYLKEADERTRVAWEIYNGKAAIAQSWNVANDFRQKLEFPKLAAKLKDQNNNPGEKYIKKLYEEIGRQKGYLKNRGEL